MVIFYFLHYMLPLTTRDLIWEYVDMVVTSIYFAFRALITQAQPPPQALRFLHRRGERETWVTGDEPLGTMGWVQTAGPLSPSCLPLRAHFHRERETSGYEADASANLKSGSTVMQTLDFVSGLHNCLEFSQPLSFLYQAMQTLKTFSIT